MEIPFLNLESMHLPLKKEMAKAFEQVYDSNLFIMGEKLIDFEKSYAIFNKTNYALGISNGLDALFIALKSLGIGPGDEVIVPSNTYIASALAVSYTGARPVFVEPDIRTYNIDPRLIAAAVNTQTRAIMPVHLYGQACEMDLIQAIAKQHNLYLVEDNAQAHGAEFKGQTTGSWGDINGTSFYPGKNLGALGDGGAVTTNSSDLADKACMLRNYGSKMKYKHDIIGYNMRLDELQAAFLAVKISHLHDWTRQRIQIAAMYNDLLDNVGDLVLPFVLPGATHVYHLYVVRTQFRDELRSFLSENGVGTLIHYPIPIHIQPAYSGMGLNKGDLPIAEEIAETCLSLPIWPGISEYQVRKVAEAIKGFFKSLK